MRREQHGFTLFELMAVIAILALVVRLVVANMGVLIPSSALNAVSGQMQGELAFVRSEAKIQGKPYRLQFDLDKNLYRMVLPEEEQLVSIQNASESNSVALNWTPIDEHGLVVLSGYNSGQNATVRKGIVDITFDENGFTADQTLYFRLAEEDTKLVWSLHIWGLTGASDLVRNHEGNEARREAPVESNF